jgi:hypothetical protein
VSLNDDRKIKVMFKVAMVIMRVECIDVMSCYSGERDKRIVILLYVDRE